MKALTAILFLGLSFSQLAFAHRYCYWVPCGSIQECKDSADWVIEGTMTDLIEGERHEMCETGPGGPMCRTISEAETLVLSDVKSIKGSHLIGQHNFAVTTKIDFCLSGPCAVITSDLEVKYLQQRVKVYGSNSRNGNSHVGYFFVEPVL